jgi:hypothetical protein
MSCERMTKGRVTVTSATERVRFRGVGVVFVWNMVTSPLVVVYRIRRNFRWTKIAHPAATSYLCIAETFGAR